MQKDLIKELEKRIVEDYSNSPKFNFIKANFQGVNDFDSLIDAILTAEKHPISFYYEFYIDRAFHEVKELYNHYCLELDIDQRNKNTELNNLKQKIIKLFDCFKKVFKLSLKEHKRILERDGMSGERSDIIDYYKSQYGSFPECLSYKEFFLKLDQEYDECIKSLHLNQNKVVSKKLNMDQGKQLSDYFSRTHLDTGRKYINEDDLIFGNQEIPFSKIDKLILEISQSSNEEIPTTAVSHAKYLYAKGSIKKKDIQGGTVNDESKKRLFKLLVNKIEND